MVADSRSHNIQKFTSDDKHNYHKRGEPCQQSSAIYISVELQYQSGIPNCRVQILNPDPIFHSYCSIGSEGSGNGHAIQWAS